MDESRDWRKRIQQRSHRQGSSSEVKEGHRYAKRMEQQGGQVHGRSCCQAARGGARWLITVHLWMMAKFNKEKRLSDTDEFFQNVGTKPSVHREARVAMAGNWVGDAPAATPQAPQQMIVGVGTSWASSGDAFWRIGESHDAMPAGVYRCGVSSAIGPHFMRVKNETDALVIFPDSESNRIVEEIRRFQGMKAKFTEHGFLHKRGVLMWGPPGSGKTTTLQLLIKLIVEEHGGVAILIDHPGTAVACLQMLRAVEPERQVVGVLEDLDALVERHGESEYLALLDGESQVDNVVYVATTNYPERLDARFVDRPSRFDTIRYIGMPSPAARGAYFDAKVPELDNTGLSARSTAPQA